MKSNRSWRWCVAGAVLLGVACNSAILEYFPAIGYAQLRGSALQADGAPFRTIFVSCGIDEPGGFAGPRDTDSLGAFDFTIVRPGDGLARDDTLACVLRAPGDGPSLVSDTIAVPFTKEREARITTTVTLRAP